MGGERRDVRGNDGRSVNSFIHYNILYIPTIRRDKDFFETKSPPTSLKHLIIR